jgi:molecular chaperone GrpE (heat shock protein)
MDLSPIVEAARVHYENLKTDIDNSKDRIEHIRLTTHAQEAYKLLTDLLDLKDETGSGDLPGELPTKEFQSPFKPKD